MRAFSLFALATAVCLSACAPKPMKVVLEPLPMRYGDNSKVKEYPFAKDPTVIHHGDQYFMYYSLMPFDPTPQDNSKPPKFNDWHAAIASSTDLVNWTRVGDMDLRDSKGNPLRGAVAPCVRKLDGKIHMFYQMAWDGTDGVANIWHAVSEDGITFTNTCDRPIIVPETKWSIKRSIDAEVYKVKDKLISLFATRDKTATYQIMGMAEA
ncbi:MAG: family 43 glycosylhydrolase, partial [Bacteroidales bacterium]|nr:family 43 glycosylhydrolase [Bacteroidales bacterium]